MLEVARILQRQSHPREGECGRVVIVSKHKPRDELFLPIACIFSSSVSERILIDLTATKCRVPDCVAIEHFQMSPNPPLKIGNLPSLAMSVSGIGVGSILN